MGRWEQYEVWEENGGRWEMAASFRDFDVASAVARTYHYRMRLVHAVYEGGTRVQENVLAEVGATRLAP